MKQLFASIVAVMGMMACTSTKKVISEDKSLGAVTVTTASSEYRTAAPRYWDILHTDIDLQPFQMRHGSYLYEAKGTAQIRLHPYFYPSDSILLDAPSMKIEQVALKHPQVKPLSYYQKEEKLVVKLDRTYAAHDTIVLLVQYVAQPYAAKVGGSKAISEDRGLYYINNNYEVPGKPKQLWTQGETQANSHWFPTFDQPNEKFTFTLRLTVPDSFVTLSNGALVKTQKTGNGVRMDTWEMRQPIQPYAIMFAVGNFVIVNDTPWKGKPIQYYVEPAYAPYALRIFQHTPQMIDFFSGVTGVPYPWNKYSQIIVRDYVSGAMENTSASLFGEFMHQNHRELADRNNEDVVSHELFHQWFGDYVTAKSWGQLTLNESFATYGEQLWRKHHYGVVSNDLLAFNDLSSYLRQAENNDPALVRTEYAHREDMFDRVSYQKGSAILRYMHGLMGDSAFYRAMNLYLRSHALGNAEVSDWRKAVETVTGTDWTPFFKQWYDKAGHPVLKLAYVYDDSLQVLQVRVQQQQESTYSLSLKAILVYDTAQQKIDWNITSRQQQFSYPYRKGVKPLFIPDCEHWIVGEIHETKTPALWLQQFLVAENDYISKRRSLTAALQYATDSASYLLVAAGLKDPHSEVRTHTLSLLHDYYTHQKHFKGLKDAIALLALQDGNNLVRAEAFKVLGAWKVFSMKEAFSEAIGDSSYAVAGAALEALSAIDSLSAYRIAAARIARGDCHAELRNAVWSILAKAGTADDFNMLATTSKTLSGRSKIALAQQLYTYVIRCEDPKVLDSCLHLLQQMAATESIKSYRFDVGAVVFRLYQYYQHVAASNNKSLRAVATSRLPIIDSYRARIIADEKDDDLIDRYRAL